MDWMHRALKGRVVESMTSYMLKDTSVSKDRVLSICRIMKLGRAEVRGTGVQYISGPTLAEFSKDIIDVTVLRPTLCLSSRT